MQPPKSATIALSNCDGMQLQKDGDWESRVDAAFAKLDSNGDGYIDLEELLAQLPFEAEESYDGERLMEVMRPSQKDVHKHNTYKSQNV